jgi:hypothetical protein
MAPHAADCKGVPREPCRPRADGPSRVREGEDGPRLNGTATGAGLPRGPPLDPRRPPAAAHHRKPRPACTRGTRFPAWGPPHRVVSPAGGVPGPRPGQKVRPACTRGTGFQAEPPLRDGRMSESHSRVYTRGAVPDVGTAAAARKQRDADPRVRRAGRRRAPRPAAPPSPSPSRGTGRDEIQLVAAEARCERFLQATPVPRSAPPLRLRRWEGQT